MKSGSYRAGTKSPVIPSKAAVVVLITQLVLALQHVMSSTKELFRYNWATFSQTTSTICTLVAFVKLSNSVFCYGAQIPIILSEDVLNDNP